MNKLKEISLWRGLGPDYEADLRARNEHVEWLLAELSHMRQAARGGGVDKYGNPWVTCPCGEEKGYRMTVEDIAAHCPVCSMPRAL